MIEVILMVFLLNMFLLTILIFFIYRNRALMNQLQTDMHAYIQKDMTNLNKVIEATMYNDTLINDKTQFVIDVLEEDDQIHNISKDSPVNASLSNIIDNVSLPDSGAWLKNITSTVEFRKLLSAA
jgi:hypothetical protein